MIDFELTYEKRLNLNKDAGDRISVYGEGFYVIDEYGKEVEEFDRLFEKFRYRDFLIDKLEKTFDNTFDYGEDNTLVIDEKWTKEIYWNLPKSKEEVSLFFDYIVDTYKYQLCPYDKERSFYNKDQLLLFDVDELT